jgi:hypothetical protein
VMKSTEAKTALCDRMNSRQLIVLPRSGAGAMSCRFRRLPTYAV